VEIAPGLRTLGEVAWHLPQSLGTLGEKLGLAVDAPDRDAPAPSVAETIAEAYRRAADSLVEQARGLWDEGSQDDVLDVYGEAWTRAQTLRVLMDHEIHHRGQLSVLMRMAGLEPSPLYGPVAQEEDLERALEAASTLHVLHPSIRQAWMIENLITVVVFTVGLLVSELLWWPKTSWWPLPPWWGAVIGVVVGFVLAVSWPGLTYRRWRYSIRTHDVILTYGVIWRVRRSIPRSRIQHVDIRSGPLDRAFGLVKCTLYTAGSGEDATIPGLLPRQAETIREAFLREGVRLG
jgi:membrane protein YdbS with pleckstrin-like domain/uncharacterized damage-inducible protein DinB